MEETQVLIFPVFPHVIKTHLSGVMLTFLDDKLVWEIGDSRREITYAEIAWIELEAPLWRTGVNLFSTLSIFRAKRGYFAVGQAPIRLSWQHYNAQEQAEIIKILRTQAPQAQYNDLALAAFRHWF
ncbi:MAG: hypothetical protein JO316_10450 [Abitibacteriaceae bacterium]|nr:hypothetical protein [Abditibacteriaceae bacterium]MBV9865762.1 hypothetical protein [Abditibacteriaceae bacterium]